MYVIEKRPQHRQRLITAIVDRTVDQDLTEGEIKDLPPIMKYLGLPDQYQTQVLLDVYRDGYQPAIYALMYTEEGAEIIDGMTEEARIKFGRYHVRHMLESFMGGSTFSVAALAALMKAVSSKGIPLFYEVVKTEADGIEMPETYFTDLLLELNQFAAAFSDADAGLRYLTECNKNL